MRVIYVVPLILAVITGCYASKGPPPRELISLKNRQQASDREIERLRKEVVALMGVVEDLRRRIRDLEASSKGRSVQEKLYGGTLEQRAFSGSDGTSGSGTGLSGSNMWAEVSRSGYSGAESESVRSSDDSATPASEHGTEEEGPAAADGRRRVVIRLYGHGRRRLARRNKRRITKFVPIKEPPAPDEIDRRLGSGSPAEIYGRAMALFRRGKYDKAARLFEQLWRRYPHSDLADNALFWRGECFYRLGRYDRALAMYRKVVDLYPEGNKAPDALLKSALALSRLGRKSEAEKLLREVMSRYPESESAVKAETVLRRNLL